MRACAERGDFFVRVTLDTGNLGQLAEHVGADDMVKRLEAAAAADAELTAAGAELLTALIASSDLVRLSAAAHKAGGQGRGGRGQGRDGRCLLYTSPSPRD